MRATLNSQRSQNKRKNKECWRKLDSWLAQAEQAEHQAKHLFIIPLFLTSHHIFFNLIRQLPSHPPSMPPLPLLMFSWPADAFPAHAALSVCPHSQPPGAATLPFSPTASHLWWRKASTGVSSRSPTFLPHPSRFYLPSGPPICSNQNVFTRDLNHTPQTRSCKTNWQHAVVPYEFGNYESDPSSHPFEFGSSSSSNGSCEELASNHPKMALDEVLPLISCRYFTSHFC